MSDAASGFTSVTYPFPVIRMADLYLMYAEALNEKGEDYATVLPWIDMVDVYKRQVSHLSDLTPVL